MAGTNGRRSQCRTQAENVMCNANTRKQTEKRRLQLELTKCAQQISVCGQKRSTSADSSAALIGDWELENVATLGDVIHAQVVVVGAYQYTPDTIIIIIIIIIGRSLAV